MKSRHKPNDCIQCLPTDTSWLSDIFSWLPPGIATGSDRFFKLDLAFCYYKNVCHYKSLFCTARCYKDTTLIMVAQHFEIITKAYETSQENLQKLKMSALQDTWWQSLPLCWLVLLLFKCGLNPLRNHFPSYVGHVTPGMTCLVTGDQQWDDIPKMSHLTGRTKYTFNNRLVLLSNNWSLTLSSKELE